MSPPFLTQRVIQTTFFFAAYYIAGVLGQATTNIRSSNIGPVWPAYGVALAAFIVCGYRVWPAIASGAFVVAFFSPVTPLAALGQAAGATVAAFVGAYLLHRISKFDSSLSRLRDALALVLLGALGSALVSATIGVSILYATHVRAYSGLGTAWLIYWLGDATGVLLVTPMILKLGDFVGICQRPRIRELTLLLFLLSGVCFLIFGDPSLIPVRLHVLAFAVLPFVMWAAIRFGVAGATLSNLLIATMATLETAFGKGPFVTSTPFTNAILLDAFFAVLSVTGLTLASAIAEREQAEHQQGALEARLAAEQAVRISEERLRLAQQAAHIGTFERDLQTGVVTWSSELEAMYGLPPGAFDRTTIAFFENLVHPEDRAGLAMLIDHTLKTGKPTQSEWRVLWPDGSVHWIAGRWQVYMDQSGKPSRMIGVNMDVTGRKQAEEVRSRHAAIVESSEDAIVSGTPEGIIVSWNAGAQRMYGYTQAEAVGKLISILFPPELPDEEIKILETLKMGGRIEQFETVRITKSGKRVNVSLSISPIKDSSGAVVGVAGIGRDVTDRKRAEEARADLSRKLIAAQEQERARIGRELHDDINQRLAMLAVELEQLQENPSEVQNRVQELRRRTTEISEDVQALSHELHSAKLEYLGVVAGMKSWCNEFAQRHRVEINFRNNVPNIVPFEMGVSLFRVLQEALHNSVKHSGVKSIEVGLREDSGEIHLIVSDSGKGFDPDAALQGRGLGLTSMRERIRLVNGTILIDSKPMGGTRIHVRVPFESDHAQKAAG